MVYGTIDKRSDEMDGSLRIQEINRDLEEVMEQMAEAERLHKKIRAIDVEVKISKEECKLLEEKLKKENKDVDQLKKMTLTNFVHTLLQNKAEKLDKEEREAFQAKVTLDAALAGLMVLQDEHKKMVYRYNELKGSNIKYSALMEEKKKLIQDVLPHVWKDIDGLNSEISATLVQGKEVQEAIQVGREVMSHVKNVEGMLDSAAAWGTYDMIGGGTLATMVKRDKMSQAQAMIHNLQGYMKRFNRELKDVDQFIHINLELDSFLGLADYFFDGFFVDFAVQSKINEAIDKIRDLKIKVMHVIGNLEDEQGSIQRRMNNLERKIANLVKAV